MWAHMTCVHPPGSSRWLYDFFFFILVTGPRRSLSLTLRDARVHDMCELHAFPFRCHSHKKKTHHVLWVVLGFKNFHHGRCLVRTLQLKRTHPGVCVGILQPFRSGSQPNTNLLANAHRLWRISSCGGTWGTARKQAGPVQSPRARSLRGTAWRGAWWARSCPPSLVFFFITLKPRIE